MPTESLSAKLENVLILDPRVGPAGGVRKSMARTGYVYDSRMTGHAEVLDPSEDMDEEDDKHPEQPQRIESIDNCLHAAGCTDLMRRIPIRAMHKHEALLVHSEDHWQKVAAIECEFLRSCV